MRAAGVTVESQCVANRPCVGAFNLVGEAGEGIAPRNPEAEPAAVGKVDPAAVAAAPRIPGTARGR
jgi:hypothetical protein